MKYVLTLLIFIFNLTYNPVIAKEKPTIEIVHNPFTVFYPHLGDSICRKKAFEIIFDKNINKEKKIKLWKKHKKICSKDGVYQLILSDMYLCYGHFHKSKEILEQSIKNLEGYDTRYHKLLLHTTYTCLCKIEKSVDLAKEMIVDYNDWHGGYRALGDNLIEFQDWNNAKKQLETALKLYDQDPVTYLRLAAVSYELKEDDKVLDYYWKAFLLDPFRPFLDWRSSAAAVGVYVLRGQFKEAKDILDQQQELFPEIKKDKRFVGVKQYYENALKKHKSKG